MVVRAKAKSGSSHFLPGLRGLSGVANFNPRGAYCAVPIEPKPWVMLWYKLTTACVN